MRVSIPVMALLAVICICACSKSNKSGLTGAAALLAGKPWKLQQTDTTNYDSAYHITSHQTIVISNCQNRFNWIFFPEMDIQGYIGCAQPANAPDAEWTWSLNQDKLTLTVSGSPRTGPVYQFTDSVITLTADSLVLSFLALPTGNAYLGPVVTDHPMLIRDWYTH